MMDDFEVPEELQDLAETAVVSIIESPDGAIEIETNFEKMNQEYLVALLVRTLFKLVLGADWSYEPEFEPEWIPDEEAGPEE